MRRKTAVRAAFLLVAVALLIVTVARERDAIGAALGRLDPWAVVLSAAGLLVGLLAQMLSWRSLFGGGGVAAPPLRTAGRIYFLGQLGKYVPGSVWALIAQAELGKDHHIGRARSAVVALGALMVLVVVGGTIGAAGLAAGSAGSLRTYWWALLAVPVGVTVLWPPVFNRLVALGLRAARRVGPAPTISGGALLRSSAWAVVMWLAFGAHAWFIAAPLGAAGPRDVATVVGAFALAWVVGFLVIIAPAGAGPREAALVLALAPVMGSADALVVALVSRVLMVLGDGAAALAFARCRTVATAPDDLPGTTAGG
ncbi:lysylphosphatidylglycerol synthase domain-containing protein [Cellulomonas sp. KRMCY2]|uniref:lysylphosphatidylglycerol synthase domain-containing protein n=1 Tax=Cellulomonas sp. KRMCY2 TaxID=1304865 RepID=UPI00045E7E35|nr:lysylphosphatidylglycerol synthase domain-containing protein [Cellulomonas sp. KRMCY2]